MDRRQLAVAALIATTLLAAPLAAQFEGVDAIAREGVTRGVYPGAAVIIGTSSRILYARGFGHFTWSASSRGADPDSTIWDLASLTKVVATTGTAAVLVDQRKLSLDAPVARYLPRFTGNGKERVTVRMLLDHTSGLPAWIDMARLTRSRAEAIDLLYATPLKRTPGGSAVYSDLNAILLGFVIESVAGVSLDAAARNLVYEPLEMRSTGYLPPRGWGARIAPTGQWRGHPVSGEVNDQNSKRLGGVAGHAGVFASASDVARYAQWWLRRGTTITGRTLLTAATVDTFIAAQRNAGPRLLGWESRATTEYDPSPYGTLPSGAAYGHTGWTGTMLWIDPGRDLFVVFLTNRAFGPKVAKPFTALHQLRARLADAAVRAAPGACRAEIRPAC